MVIRNEHVLDVAAAVLARRPDATLQTIADAAGISRTTIFNKYPRRDDLLAALAVDALARIGQAMAVIPPHADADAHEVLLRLTGALMDLGPRTVFLRTGPGTSLESYWAEALTPLALYIDGLQSAGRLRSDQPARWLTAAYIGLLFAAWDEMAEGELRREQATRLIVDTWLSGSVSRAVTARG
jgi:AcrR family transcriptional regulator